MGYDLKSLAFQYVPRFFFRQMMTGFGGSRGNGTLYSYCDCWKYVYVSLFVIYIYFTIVHYFVFMILLFSLFSNLASLYIAWLHPSRQHIPIGSFAWLSEQGFRNPAVMYRVLKPKLWRDLELQNLLLHMLILYMFFFGMCFLNTHMRWFSPHKTRVEPCFEGSNRFEDGMQWFKLGGSSWLSQPKHPLDLGSEQNLTKRSMDLIHFPGDFRCFFFNLNPSSLWGEGHN